MEDEPAEGVMVTFTPLGSTPGHGGIATTDSQGNYSLKNRESKAGIPAGEYRVTLSKFVGEDGSPVPSDIQPESVGAKQVIPERYTGQDSEETVTVSPQATIFDYSL